MRALAIGKVLHRAPGHRQELGPNGVLGSNAPIENIVYKNFHYNKTHRN